LGYAGNQWFRVLLLCLTVMFCQTTLSMGAELFDLNDLSTSQQNRFWIQVDNWAAAVVLAGFCERAYFAGRTNAQDCKPLCHCE
jgi:hypothetical protein